MSRPDHNGLERPPDRAILARENTTSPNPMTHPNHHARRGLACSTCAIMEKAAQPSKMNTNGRERRSRTPATTSNAASQSQRVLIASQSRGESNDQFGSRITSPIITASPDHRKLGDWV